MFKEGLLKGKRILVTGGGTGLGKEIAAKYLDLGAELWLCGRRGAVLESTAKELVAGRGGVVRTHSVDIRDAVAVDAMVQRIWDESGPLTGLVNNAAGNFISPTKDLTPNGFNAIANIVFHGTFYVTHAVGKRWIAGGVPGSVLTIVVTWVHTGSPYVVPSAMSKAGVLSDRRRGEAPASRGRLRGHHAPQPHAAHRPHGGAAEPCHLPHGRRLRVAHRRDDRAGRRRLPRLRLGRLLHSARQALRRRLGQHARAHQGAERQGPRRPQRVMAQVPRPAATLILLRPGGDGIEVLMIQRAKSAAFLGGAYVFPGGALDAADSDLKRRILGTLPPEPPAEYYIAAVRECFEEAGVALLCGRNEAQISSARAALLVNRRQQPFLEILEKEDLYIPAGELVYYANWITAPGRSRRFDARFFVAVAPEGQEGSHDAAETVQHLWISPREALARGERG